LAKVVQTKFDESFAVDVFSEQTRAEFVAHGIREGSATPRSCLTFVGANDLWTTGIEMEVKRSALVFAERSVIELAQDVSRHIAYDQSHDLLVDPSLTIIECVTDRFVERSRRQSSAGERCQIDPASLRRNRMKLVPLGGEIVLDDSLPAVPTFTFLDQLAPRIRAGVVE